MSAQNPSSSNSAESESTSGVQPLPKGAMPTQIPTLKFQPAPSATRFSEPEHPPSPPATPSQRLLDGDPSHVQFASYPVTPEEKTRPLMEEEGVPSWLGAYTSARVIALHFTKKNNGWKTHGNTTNGVMHYVYTLPPVIVAAVIVALWTWTDIEIKKMQPYVDLVRGDAPPEKSLLLDYTRTNNFLVWTAAARNRHWVVTAASIMVLVTLCFQPLASALLSVRNTWIPLPDATMNTLFTVSLNQDQSFLDLTTFLTAAGYASANVGYNLQQPPFILQPYTVAPFQIPTNLATNGTVTANTTVVKTDTHCATAQVTMTVHPDGSGWNNSLSQNGCTLLWEVDRSAESLFGTSTCGDSSTPPQFQPVVFWFFTYQPTAQSSATICTPSISLLDATVTLDLASGNITNVKELQPFSSSSNYSSLAGNVTGAPLNGRAYNGINFTLENPDSFILARMNATQLTMPAAVFQAAVQSQQGLVGSFSADLFVNWSNDVYITYLTLIAKAVYFLPNQEPITLQVKTFQNRLWLSDLAVHLLAALLIILAISAAVIHIFHRYERQDLNLLHQPGTIASAVSIGATTEMGQLLAQQRDADGIHQALQDKRFRIDPYSMKIMMQGEEGYEAVGSPMDRRRSVFGAMQGKRASRRFSRAPGSPGVMPRSPRTPQSANSGAGAAV
ncbi:Non-specific serine/threonine protein kinase [Mycena sanguinolenta]|uniref:Non-specific serine/threonine protein kinase n=1 Tax=Mycena sanguinolenta TaxID=230812 RepID=A0A8H6YAD8_9AGAR|nr:Non-specific serine/threonine protein kinase [Mycena sanguinolenta]